MAISTTSITLIPVTAMGLRAAVQTEGAAEIIAPVIIATTISTVTGIVFTIIFEKTKKWKFENVIAVSYTHLTHITSSKPCTILLIT